MLAYGLSVLVLLSSFAASAKIVRIVDFDGTIVNDRGPTATWITPWVLKRVEDLSTTLQQAPNESITVDITEPAQIEYLNRRYKLNHDPQKPLRWSLRLDEHLRVSYDEYVRFQADWAAGETSFGGLKPVLLNDDPLHPERERLIIPGYYREFDLTFKYYRRSSSGKNHLIPQYHEAIARADKRGSPATWKGSGFEFFAAGMSDPQTVQDVIILTSRGQDPQEFHQLFTAMKTDGHIKHAISDDGKRPEVFALSLPEARLHGRGMVERKVNVFRNKFESLVRSAGNKHEETTVDGYGRFGKRSGHVLMVLEDDPAIFDAIAEMALKLSGGMAADSVKIVLFNSGSDDDIRRSRFQYRTVVISAGRQVREATAEEIAAWSRIEDGKRTSWSVRIARSCQRMHFGGGR